MLSIASWFFLFCLQRTDGAARGCPKWRTKDLLPIGVGRCSAVGRRQTRPDGSTDSRADQRL